MRLTRVLTVLVDEGAVALFADVGQLLAEFINADIGFANQVTNGALLVVAAGGPDWGVAEPICPEVYEDSKSAIMSLSQHVVMTRQRSLTAAGNGVNVFRICANDSVGG